MQNLRCLEGIRQGKCYAYQFTNKGKKGSKNTKMFERDLSDPFSTVRIDLLDSYFHVFPPVLTLICLLFHSHGVSIRTSDAKNVGQLQPTSRRGYKDQRRINFSGHFCSSVISGKCSVKGCRPDGSSRSSLVVAPRSRRRRFVPLLPLRR